MSSAIIKLTDGDESWYMEWSTVSDDPASWGMKLLDFRAYYLDEYGKHGMKVLEGRLERVEEHGSTYMLPSESAEDVVLINRAGPGESELSVAEIIERYCKTRRGNE